MKRRIMFDKSTGKILMMEVAEDLIANENIGMILEDADIDREKFDNAKDFKVDIKTNKVIFGEIKEKEKTKEDIEKELLKAQSEIVDLKYKELVNKNI